MKKVFEYIADNYSEIIACGKYLIFFFAGGCVTALFLAVIFYKKEEEYSPITKEHKKEFGV